MCSAHDGADTRADAFAGISEFERGAVDQSSVRAEASRVSIETR